MLHVIAVISLILAGLCSLIVAVDAVRHPQRMWIMNSVWILTPLYSSVLGLWAYYALGRMTTNENIKAPEKRGRGGSGRQKPFWQSVAVGAMHCGSGCTLGDIIAEWFIFFVPFSLFGREIFGGWVLDFVVALLLGIVFQYFTIKPMRDLSVGEGIIEAVKADTLSLTAWQIGMYGWMAIVVFVIFGQEFEKTDPIFWFMMQIAMMAGFLTSYPVNWFLLSKKIKEVM